MNATHLNEHDANQGAQSSGEFLGMTGNSGWYLLGSGGAAIMMVILLWGILGVSLLLCLFVGIVLCLLSIAYVFALKNNKPEHYDTDFLESAMVEAGVLRFCFGPRLRLPVNPFTDGADVAAEPRMERKRSSRQSASTGRGQNNTARAEVAATEPLSEESSAKQKITRKDADPLVTRAAFERLHEQLTTTQEMLEEALAEHAED